MIRFQSTLPRGERHWVLVLWNRSHLYFNPRSREGSDTGYSFYGTGAICISIHAPARGATVFAMTTGTANKISIHAPARGATQEYMDIKEDLRNFNPRSREGSDVSAFFVISNIKRFQSTLPRGERRFLGWRVD